MDQGSEDRTSSSNDGERRACVLLTDISEPRSSSLFTILTSNSRDMFNFLASPTVKIRLEEEQLFICPSLEGTSVRQPLFLLPSSLQRLFLRLSFLSLLSYTQKH